LGDKAYVGDDNCVAPHKKRRGQARLPRALADYNNVHRFDLLLSTLP